MPLQRIRHPEFPLEYLLTGYPFSDAATLTNSAGDELAPGTFLDAALWPIGGQARMYLANVNIAHDQITLTIGDPAQPALASGSFPLATPPATLTLLDAYNRPAGLLVSEPVRLAAFAAWAPGDHPFTVDQAEFVSSCCMPTPEVGVRGVLLDDGTFLTDEVWLVGDNGVVLSTTAGSEPLYSPVANVGTAVIRVDVVGDPLYRRALCDPTGLFTTPRFVRALAVSSGPQSFTVKPDAAGNILLSASDAQAVDTVLRVRTAAAGIVIEAVGSGATTLGG